MKRITSLILLPLLVLGLFSCKTNKSGQTNTTQADEFISLENTGCRGYCPAFVFSLNNDGSATYHGRRNVDNMGHFKGTLKDPAPLFKKFQESNFESYENEYLSGLADIPRIKITYNQKNIVGHKNKLPEPLLELASLTENEIQNIAWGKTEAPKE